MHILYVTRKYPPGTGGMENAAHELYMALSATEDVTLIKWGGSNKLLPLVYPWLLMRALAAGLQKKPDVIYLQDGIMATLGWILKLLLRCPTLITIHGKEATYSNPLYRIMVSPFIGRQDRLVAVSNDTKQTIQKAFPGVKPLVIFNGVSDVFYNHATRTESRIQLAKLIDLPLERLQRSRILHTGGRFVRRKGVLWFVDEVLPQLVAEDPSILYLVSGDGKDRGVIEAVVAQRHMGDHVVLLGRIPNPVLYTLYNAADLFVMPNIPVANDMEGFGLVALEAASCGTTVIASNLEGIPDAIQDGQNGILVRPGDVQAYVETIRRELRHRSLRSDAVRHYTLAHYAWAERAREYVAVMQRLIS